MVRDNRKPDLVLLGVTIFLIIFGILILASVSAFYSQVKYNTTYYYLNHQLLFGLLPGLIFAIFAFKIPLDFLKKIAPIIFLINLILTALVFLPKIGVSAGGATRWLNLGVFSFQPTEFLKLTFILYLASWLNSRAQNRDIRGKENEKSFVITFGAFLIVIVLISLLLIFQPDISTLGIILIVALIMYFLANTPLWHSILMIFFGIVGLLILIKIAPYRMERILVFLNPETDPMGIGYQIKQSLIAVGSGGIFGRGLGMSQLKYGFLPESISDSIFAIFAEEGGFIGCTILILFFLIFCWRGIKIAKMVNDKFYQLTALGITCWISLQVFINIGSMTGILPLSGTPLPFVSYGGSALVAELIGVGILLNISKKI